MPIKGKGLWSTLYGFLCLSNDFQTVIGITFYEHAETPGLGGEVDNPNWKKMWKGKKVTTVQYEPLFVLSKESSKDNPHAVDALSGATITSRGVQYMINFWLGKNGYKPYLDKLRQEKSY